jgi:energy-coupling factor transporter transmembrane protein EcfT
VTFSYQISLSDYQEAQKLIRRLAAPWSRWLRGLALFVYGLMLLATLLIFVLARPKFHDAFLAIRPMLVFLTILILLPLLTRFQASRAYRKNPMIRRRISVSMDEEHYQAEDGEGTKSISPWSNFDRFAEGKRVFVIGSRSKIYSIISKSQMTDIDTAQVREVLSKAVPRN